jgi:hypothetical protein
MAAIKLLPTVTVGTTAVQVDQRTQASRGFQSLSMQADGANSGVIYVGDSTVTTSLYARALSAGDWMTVTADGVDGSAIYVVGSAAGQILHPSGL